MIVTITSAISLPQKEEESMREKACQLHKNSRGHYCPPVRISGFCSGFGNHIKFIEPWELSEIGQE
jgi:hypothetical protein